MIQSFAISLVLACGSLRTDGASEGAGGGATAAVAVRDGSVKVPAVERIVVVGSSVSDGFGLEDDVGVKTTLADIVAATLKPEHEPVRSLANPLFFYSPETTGPGMVKVAHGGDPTLVVAIDYLFWFGYGEIPQDADRLALLERGLKSLEIFSCPILVGDFPDMSLAVDAQAAAGAVLAKTQVPSPASLEKLNQRLRAWAAKDARRIVVPVSELMRRLRADEEFALRRNTWFRGSLRFLLQKDKLHTTLEGSIAVWLHALDELVRAQPDVPASAFEWDAKAIWRAVYASKEAERQAIAEKKLEQLRQERRPPPEPPPPAGGETKRKDG